MEEPRPTTSRIERMEADMRQAETDLDACLAAYVEEERNAHRVSAAARRYAHTRALLHRERLKVRIPITDPWQYQQIAAWAWVRHLDRHGREVTREDPAPEGYHQDPLLCMCFQRQAPAVRQLLHRGSQLAALAREVAEGIAARMHPGEQYASTWPVEPEEVTA